MSNWFPNVVLVRPRVARLFYKHYIYKTIGNAAMPCRLKVGSLNFAQRKLRSVLNRRCNVGKLKELERAFSWRIFPSQSHKTYHWLWHCVSLKTAQTHVCSVTEAMNWTELAKLVTNTWFVKSKFLNSQAINRIFHDCQR